MPLLHLCYEKCPQQNGGFIRAGNLLALGKNIAVSSCYKAVWRNLENVVKVWRPRYFQDLLTICRSARVLKYVNPLGETPVKSHKYWKMSCGTKKYIRAKSVANVWSTITRNFAFAPKFKCWFYLRGILISEGYLIMGKLQLVGKLCIQSYHPTTCLLVGAVTVKRTQILSYFEQDHLIATMLS